MGRIFIFAVGLPQLFPFRTDGWVQGLYSSVSKNVGLVFKLLCGTLHIELKLFISVFCMVDCVFKPG